MERETSQLGFNTRSDTSPPFFQHQFFPTDGIQSSHANNVESTNGRVPSEDGHNIGEGSVFPPHWDMKNWNWDPAKFVAQRAGGREEGSSEDPKQFDSTGNGSSHRAFDSGNSTDRPSTREQPGRGSEDDERGNTEDEMGNTERSGFKRETPSPPFNDGHSLPGDDDSQDVVGSLLKLGGDAYVYAEENAGGSQNGKKIRSSSPQYQVPSCQVDGCKADLSRAKDYYRRHKVCEMHSKSTKATVSGLMQRFCQQCSRFHPLQEFDEGKRSCRRRLAGHNRRRRKTQPDADGARVNIVAKEEQLSNGDSGLIRSLLNILSQLTGTTPLNRVNAPVFDREALLRKAITNSLEDINRTTPLWAQLLTNPHHLPFAFDQQAQQLAASNGHGATNVAMEAQRLLSRLTDRSPEHLMLQNSLNAQIVAASMTIQNTLGSLMQGAIGPGHFPLGSTSRLEAQAGPSCTPQTYVVPTPTSAGVFQSVLSSPIPGRATPVKEVVRPTPVVPMSSPQRNSEQSIHHGVPALHSLFTPYQAPPKNNGRGAATSSHLPTDGRMPPAIPFMGHREPPAIPFMGHREPPANMDGPSSNARRERDLKDPVQQSNGNSQSGLDEQQPSSFNESVERRNRTRRIAMKLFERSPEELPIDLRSKIDLWLANLPSNMESYIRPGCLVLTIFVSMPTCGWTELDRDLQGSVQKLLDMCKEDFWHRGRILVQVEHQMVLVIDGKIQESRWADLWDHPYIQSVRPLAVEAGEAATIAVRGFNLTPPDTRLLCAHQGKYLLRESVGVEHNQVADTSCDTEEDEVDESVDSSVDCSNLSKIGETSVNLDAEFTFCGEHPHAVGRCFLEVEYGTTLANARPLIIADRSVCSELCTLEDEVELAGSCTTQAALLESLEPVEVLGCGQVARLVVEEDITSFLHELGWYFQSGVHRQTDGSFALDEVSATRLKCLLIFSVERSWCAVVGKLFDIALTSQDIGTGIARLSQVVHDDQSLLHRAVRRKSRGMVELLLAYVPSCMRSETMLNAVDADKLMQFRFQWGALFRPDMSGPGGLTPLHIAASMQDGEDMVDALTSDPFQVGLHAWVNKRDESGQTPLHCAMAGSNLRSIELVRDKLAALQGSKHQVCINILPDSLVPTWVYGSAGAVQGGGGGPCSIQLAEWVESGSAPVKNPSVNKGRATCRIHAQRAHFGGVNERGFRRFVLSLVAIATICACVCVMIRSPPTVRFVMQPFRWERLGRGQM